jgi:hypothetical protein
MKFITIIVDDLDYLISLKHIISITPLDSPSVSGTRIKLSDGSEILTPAVFLDIIDLIKEA